MWRSMGTSRRGLRGMERVEETSLGCTTWLSPSKIPSAKMRTDLMMVSLEVERVTSTCGCGGLIRIRQVWC